MPHLDRSLVAAVVALAVTFGAHGAAAYTVVTSDEDVTVDCGTSGTDVPTDWYFPVPNPNRGLVWVQHGFSRTNNQYVDLATKIAEQGYVVFATSLAPGTSGCAMNNQGFLSDFARLFPDLAVPGVGLLGSASIAATEAGTTLTALPASFAFTGHSAGGGSIAWVAKELVTAHPATGASLRGLVFLDPVESTSGALMASSLPSLGATRVTTISSPPYTCNSSASGTTLIAGLPRPFVGVELTSGCHCDAEGSSTNALCTAFCGTPQAANVSALQTLALCWLGDAFTGGYSAGCYPGGAYYQSQLAANRIRTLPDPGTCGNGVVNAGEQCDDGNEINGDCCSGICQFEPSGAACASDGNPCTDDVCSGGGACGVPNASPCNDGVFCNGADTCSGGACSQHAGNPCASGAECATVCNEATDDCRDPAGVACASDGNPCTVDACTGTGSCGHAPGNAGAECRSTQGVCDVPETCTGLSSACPPNGFVPSGATCRPAAGACDGAETCTGASATCPADGRQPAGSPCASDGNPCSLDQCDGIAVDCQHPAGNAGVPCRASAGPCDVSETCTGTATVCPSDGFASSAVVCRASTGTCDAAETCSGSAPACPPDAAAPAGTPCRPASGPCDLAESCNGSATTCPANGFAASTTVCRPSSGVCDVAESCSGSAASCPADGFATTAVTCRSAAGVCDAAEQCSGASATCPADAALPAGVECRPSAGACDLPELCSGTSTTCPADTGRPDGDADGVCDVEDICPTLADPPQSDGDGDGLGDVCDPCTNGLPVIAVKARLTLRNGPLPFDDDRFKLSGTMTVPSGAVDPAVDGLRVIIVDAGGHSIVDATVPPGPFDPVQAAGWTVNAPRTAFKYRNKGGAILALDGVDKVVVKRSTKVPGQVKFSIQAAGGAYPIPTTLPVSATVILDPPYASTNQCGDVLFPGPSRPTCAFTAPAGTVKCK